MQLQTCWDFFLALNYAQQLPLLFYHLLVDSDTSSLPTLPPPPRPSPSSFFDDLRSSDQAETKGKMEMDFSHSADRPRDD